MLSRNIFNRVIHENLLIHSRTFIHLACFRPLAVRIRDWPERRNFFTVILESHGPFIVMIIISWLMIISAGKILLFKAQYIRWSWNSILIIYKILAAFVFLIAFVSTESKAKWNFRVTFSMACRCMLVNELLADCHSLTEDPFKPFRVPFDSHGYLK